MYDQGMHKKQHGSATLATQREKKIKVGCGAYQLAAKEYIIVYNMSLITLKQNKV